MSAKSVSALVLLVAFAAGACTLAVELADVRLLAPWFGTSSVVWTNVIGVVLLGLSAGYWIGGTLSARAHPARSLVLALACAAALAAWLPGASGSVARFFLPDAIALEEASDLLAWGSLATALVLFLPSSASLGCIAPLCTEVLQRLDQGAAGRAGGRVLCASTLGSLCGAFVTTYVAIPRMGMTLTFLAAGLVLAGCAASAWIAVRAARARSAPLAFLWGVGLAASVFSRAPAPRVGADATLLDAAESRYQSVRIVESGTGAERLRFLQVNESFDSFQSAWQAKLGFLPQGFYYNAFAAPVWWSHAPARWRLLVLGLGGGTTWRVIEGTKPTRTSVDYQGAEIDPLVVDLARRWLDLGAGDVKGRVLSGLDARVALRALEPGFDQIVLDAYANQMEIPAHLCSREFFEETFAKLADGGWLCANVGGFGFDDPVVAAIARTVATAFQERVLIVRVPFSRNFALYARRGATPPEPGATEWRTGSTEVDALFSALVLRSAWRWVTPDQGPILTDDLDPIEALQRRSIALASERARSRP